MSEFENKVNELETEAQQALIIQTNYTQDNIMAGSNFPFYSSVPTDTTEGKMAVFNALTDADNMLNDFINKRIKVVDIIATVVEIADEDTGEIGEAPRVILIDDKGEAYNAISKGVHSAVKNLVNAFGQPSDWDGPIEIEVLQRKVARGSMTTFKVVKVHTAK